MEASLNEMRSDRELLLTNFKRISYKHFYKQETRGIIYVVALVSCYFLLIVCTLITVLEFTFAAGYLLVLVRMAFD